MFNPFSVFQPGLLMGFKKKGVKAFVQQTYDRGRNMLEENIQPAFVLIHFNDANKAREHFDAIKTDPGRELYHLDEQSDWQRLETMLSTPGQRFYTILTIKDANEKAQKVLDKRIRSYINYKTNWRPAGGQQVGFSLEIILGEIYVRLQYGAYEVKLKMDELENQHGYVL